MKNTPLHLFHLFQLFGHSNVSVLDGGFRKWTTDGFPVAEGQNETKVREGPRTRWSEFTQKYVQICAHACHLFLSKGQRGNFTCTWKESRLRSYEDMQKVVSDNSAQVVDCRLDVHFDGSLPEPNECKNFLRFAQRILCRFSMYALEKGCSIKYSIDISSPAESTKALFPTFLACFLPFQSLHWFWTTTISHHSSRRT